MTFMNKLVVLCGIVWICALWFSPSNLQAVRVHCQNGEIEIDQALLSRFPQLNNSLPDITSGNYTTFVEPLLVLYGDLEQDGYEEQDIFDRITTGLRENITEGASTLLDVAEHLGYFDETYELFSSTVAIFRRDSWPALLVNVLDDMATRLYNTCYQLKQQEH